MNIIDGKKISDEVKEKLKIKIEEEELTPGLAIIMVGNNPASEIYVKNKLKASEKIGVKATVYHFDELTEEKEIISCILKLNEDTNTHGIIVQSPLPSHLNEENINEYIIPSKDVDGFGVYSLGKLASGEESFLSATPAGIMEMLNYENIDVTGKNAVIIGRSKIVGRPMALTLLNHHATTIITHSKTKELKEITKIADVLIVAIGKPKFITDEYIKEGAIVIDVGINRTEDGKIVGDVDFDSASKKASYITPVPGGVGPMTIALLLKNVVKSAENFKNGKELNKWTRELKKH